MYKIGIYPERGPSIKDLSLEDKGKLLDGFFCWNETGDSGLNGYLKTIFNIFQNRLEIDKASYNKQCKIQKDRIQSYWDKKKNTTVFHGIPENTNDIPDDSGNTNSNSNSSNIIKNNIKTKEDIREFFTEEEILQKRDLLSILREIIDCGEKIEKEKKSIQEYLDWIIGMCRDTVGEINGGVPRSTCLDYAKTRKEYWKVRYKTPEYNKKEKNFKSSMRNAFKMYNQNKTGK